MKSKQLLSSTGKKIGGIHPAVARKMVRDGSAEEREGHLHLTPRVKPSWGHLECERKETRWYPITHGTLWEIGPGEPQPAHCVLHLYVNDPDLSKGRNLEMVTRKGGRMWTHAWNQVAEVVDDDLRWLSVEEWLRRLDQGEYVTPYEGAEDLSAQARNVWIIHQTPEGDQAIQMWVALHYPMWAEKDYREGEFPCTFIAAIKFDYNQRLLLDDWWNVAG